MSFPDFRIGEFRCLNCGQKLNAVTNATDDSAPSPGDLSACIKCGAVMIFGEDLKLRPFSPAEAEELEKDEQLVAHLRNVVGAIYFLKHAQS